MLTRDLLTQNALLTLLLFLFHCRYTKNAHRSRLRDELASATLHVQQLRVLVNSEVLESSDSLTLEFNKSLSYVENNLDDLREKYLGTDIVKQFEDRDGQVRGFRGEVSAVDWSRDDGCFLFHVVYDSDSDEEDMELWEVKKYETSET